MIEIVVIKFRFIRLTDGRKLVEEAEKTKAKRKNKIENVKEIPHANIQ